MGWVSGKWNMVFYADDGRIARRDHIWVQHDLTVTVEMFNRVSLDKNLKNQSHWYALPVNRRASPGRQQRGQRSGTEIC